MLKAILPLLLCLASVTTASFTHAEESNKRWSGGLELGYVDTSGNTESTSIKSRIDTVWESGKWRDTIHFESLNLEEDEERTAEKYLLSNKVDYKYSEKSYSFVYASYEDDRFSGFDWQGTVSLGYGRRILDRSNATLDVEAGPGYRVSKYEEEDASGEDKEDESIIRLYGKYNWTISESATFEQELSVEKGSYNTVSKSITSLKTTIIGQLAMKLSHTVKYTEEVPTDKENRDTETAVTILYSFLLLSRQPLRAANGRQR